MRKWAILAILAAVLGSPVSARRHKNIALRMEATAFVKHSGKETASGTVPRGGIVAADPKVLPMGTRIRISGAGKYNGEYLVTDTGANIAGRRIDICVGSPAEARRFGRRTVTVRILQLGAGKEDARDKEGTAASSASGSK